MNTVPLWIVASLGQQVELAETFEGTCETYPAGYPAKLVSIQAGEEFMHVTVQLRPDDWGYEENFRFHQVRPIGHVKMSIDLEEGTITF